MPIRLKWTIDKIKQGFEKFYSEKGRYPTSAEIDEYPDLPSSRQIERRYGGVPQLRKELGLEGPHDFTKGQYSSDRARTIGLRSIKLEHSVNEYLVSIFGKPFVHREYLFTDDRRTRTDFFVYCANGNFCTDVFYPKDKRNLSGCLNSKLGTYGGPYACKYPVVFLMMNENISEEVIQNVLKNKTNKLHGNHSVMTFTQFKKFCAGKRPLAKYP